VMLLMSSTSSAVLDGWCSQKKKLLKRCKHYHSRWQDNTTHDVILHITRLLVMQIIQLNLI
jgi:hypothetical protein